MNQPARQQKPPAPEPLERRNMPANIEAERNILGAILLDSSALNDCIDIIAPEDFYHPPHTIIYKAMIDIDTDGDEINEFALERHLATAGELEAVGGLEYVALLVDGSISPVNIRYYARSVKELSQVRKFINKHDALVAQALEPGTKINELLDAAEDAQANFQDDSQGNDFSPIDVLVDDSLKYLDDAMKNPEKHVGIETGLPGLDDLTTGLQGGDYFILAARPSMGKTALSLQIARHVGMTGERAVGIFSLEMSQRALVMRMLSAEAGVGAQAMRTRHLRKEDYRSLFEAGERLSTANILIDDTAGTNIAELRGKAKRMAQRQERLGKPPLGMIVVDYLQLLTLPEYRLSGRGNVGRQQEIAEISRALKLLAIDLDVPIICLSQLNRSIEERGPTAVPRLADLRESGAIEQDADIVAFIAKYKGDDAEAQPEGGFTTNVSLVIAKQRNGPTGTVNLVFRKEVQHFGEMGDAMEPEEDY